MPIKKDLKHNLLAITLLCCLTYTINALSDSTMIWGERYPAFGFTETEQSKKPERPLVLPNYPEDGNLIEVRGIFPDGANQVYLDKPSISFDKDGIVRYTTLIRTPNGTQTVSYEGIRCQSPAEHKIFAFGRKNKTWGINTFSQWRPVNISTTQKHTWHLASTLFCVDDVIKGQDALKTIHKKLE